MVHEDFMKTWTVGILVTCFGRTVPGGGSYSPLKRITHDPSCRILLRIDSALEVFGYIPGAAGHRDKAMKTWLAAALMGTTVWLFCDTQPVVLPMAAVF